MSAGQADEARFKAVRSREIQYFVILFQYTGYCNFLCVVILLFRFFAVQRKAERHVCNDYGRRRFTASGRRL